MPDVIHAQLHFKSILGFPFRTTHNTCKNQRSPNDKYLYNRIPWLLKSDISDNTVHHRENSPSEPAKIFSGRFKIWWRRHNYYDVTTYLLLLIWVWCLDVISRQITLSQRGGHLANTFIAPYIMGAHDCSIAHPRPYMRSQSHTKTSI